MSKKNTLILVCSFLFVSIPTIAQSNEVSFSVGGVFATGQSQHASFPIICPVTVPNCTNLSLTTSPGVSFMGNFARRITAFGPVAFYVEAPVVGGPSRDVNSTLRSAGFQATVVAFSSSSLFFTPSAKLRFWDSSAISPFASVGGGLAHLGLSGTDMNTGALQFGAGADFKSAIPHLLFRAEARDFFSSASLHSAGIFQVSPSHQHVVFAGGGAVFRF